MQNLYQFINCSQTVGIGYMFMSNVTLHVDMIPLTVEDRLFKTSQTEKVWIINKTMIIEFQTRQRKWHMHAV